MYISLINVCANSYTTHSENYTNIHTTGPIAQLWCIRCWSSAAIWRCLSLCFKSPTDLYRENTAAAFHRQNHDLTRLCHTPVLTHAPRSFQHMPVFLRETLKNWDGPGDKASTKEIYIQMLLSKLFWLCFYIHTRTCTYITYFPIPSGIRTPLNTYSAPLL